MADLLTLVDQTRWGNQINFPCPFLCLLKFSTLQGELSLFFNENKILFPYDLTPRILLLEMILC